MKIAIIPPTSSLDLFGPLGDNYHLCLSHEILSNREHAQFYAKMAAKGHFIILDNSAHETGFGDHGEALLEAARLIGWPSEIVLPDRLFFGEDTAEGSIEAASYLRGKLRRYVAGKDIRFMGAPQGRIKSEWTKCLVKLLIDARVDTIGISKDYEVWPDGIPGLVQTTLNVAEELGRPDVQIHLLGWGRDLLQLKECSKLFGDRLRGVDSAKPLVYAAAGVRLSPEMIESPVYPKRHGFFETASVDPELAQHNIQIFRIFANWGQTR